MSSLGQAARTAVREGVTLLQLNVEGLTKAKINILEHLVSTHKATTILLQETHVMDTSRLKIAGYTLAAHTESAIHGTATFVKQSAKWKHMATCAANSETEWTAVEVKGVNVINVYKPPPAWLLKNSIPTFSSPCIYAGDFNCHSIIWGYSATNHDGTALEEWASASLVKYFNKLMRS